MHKDKYVYNIKEKMQEFKKIRKPLKPRSNLLLSRVMKPAIMKSPVLAARRERSGLRKTKSLNYYDMRYPKPVYSPYFRSKFSKGRLTERKEIYNFEE